MKREVNLNEVLDFMQRALFQTKKSYSPVSTDVKMGYDESEDEEHRCFLTAYFHSARYPNVISTAVYYPLACQITLQRSRFEAAAMPDTCSKCSGRYLVLHREKEGRWFLEGSHSCKIPKTAEEAELKMKAFLSLSDDVLLRFEAVRNCKKVMPARKKDGWYGFFSEFKDTEGKKHSFLIDETCRVKEPREKLVCLSEQQMIGEDTGNHVLFNGKSFIPRQGRYLKKEELDKIKDDICNNPDYQGVKFYSNPLPGYVCRMSFWGMAEEAFWVVGMLKDLMVCVNVLTGVYDLKPYEPVYYPKPGDLRFLL